MKNQIILIAGIFLILGILCFIFGAQNSFAYTAGYFWIGGAVGSLIFRN